MPAYDVVVYGTTIPALFAAIRFARSQPGATVCCIGEWGRTGGMTTGGLTVADNVDDAVYWGLAEEYWQAIGAEYGQVDTLFWRFEPSVAQLVLNAMIAAEANLTVVLGEHLVSVQTEADGDERRIVSLTTDVGVYVADHFVCGNYEGDLAAHAGVPMQYGREARSRYNEGGGGVNYSHAYEINTRPTATADGGLLYWGGYRPPQADGDADAKVQGFNFRLQMTTEAGRLPWPAPPGYDEAFFQRVFGASAALLEQIIDPQWIVADDGVLFQSNFNDIDGQLVYSWVTATHAERVQMKADFYRHFMGRLHYHATSSNVSQDTRNSFAVYGLNPAEFQTDYYHTPGMSPEIYVREGRRIIGREVLTENDVLANAEISDPICVGGYFMDRHTVQTYPQLDGTGSVAEGPNGYLSRKYYPIGLRHILPARVACNNLVSVWGISVSSMAWCSARMEPTLAMVADAAGMALSVAHAEGVPVGHVTYSDIRPALDNEGAVYHFVPGA